jgi:hypothetical protein
MSAAFGVPPMLRAGKPRVRPRMPGFGVNCALAFIYDLFRDTQIASALGARASQGVGARHAVPGGASRRNEEICPTHTLCRGALRAPERKSVHWLDVERWDMLHSRTSPEGIMAAITFDTHEFIKDLQSKGFKPEQAEGISDALKNVMTIAEVATKNDIKEVENKIDKLELKIQAQINPIKWMSGVAAAGIISLVLKTFF